MGGGGDTFEKNFSGSFSKTETPQEAYWNGKAGRVISTINCVRRASAAQISCFQILKSHDTFFSFSLRWWLGGRLQETIWSVNTT